MATVSLNGQTIADWPSFHRECQAAFGFPDFYGCNMDAWIDCLSYLRDDEGMTKFRLAANEVLHIDVLHADALRNSVPGLLDELEGCIAFINDRYADYGEKPALSLKLR
jgi:hypothetical protein